MDPGRDVFRHPLGAASRPSAKVDLSVVIPAYNEAAVLPRLAGRLRSVLDDRGGRYEVVVVDDGSTDDSTSVLAELRRSWPELRVLRLRTNCGHQAALLAGLFSTRGDYVVSMDADLQDPPEKIPEMVETAHSRGLDVVLAVRTDRSVDSGWFRLGARIYYGLMRRVVGRQVPADAGDFRLVSRAVVDVLRVLPERSPVLRLLIPWLGFPTGEVQYARAMRAAGESKYPLWKRIVLIADSVTSFTSAPLRIATFLGLAGIVVCGALIVWAAVEAVVNRTVSGWASVFIAVLFVGAVQLLGIGLLGEYVARIYIAIQGRPTYTIASDSIDEVEADESSAPARARSV